MRAPTAAKPSSPMPRVAIAVLPSRMPMRLRAPGFSGQSDAIGDQAVALEPTLRGAAVDLAIAQIEDDHVRVGAAEIEREARPLE